MILAWFWNNFEWVCYGCWMFVCNVRKTTFVTVDLRTCIQPGIANQWNYEKAKHKSEKKQQNNQHAGQDE